MEKDEIITQVQKLLFEDSRDLSRDDYKDLLHSIIDDCKTSLEAMECDIPETD